MQQWRKLYFLCGDITNNIEAVFSVWRRIYSAGGVSSSKHASSKLEELS
jgi:hypothetical protein